MRPVMQMNLIAGLLCLLLLSGTVHADDVLWKSGANLYIKLAEQDESRQEATPPNQHPVQLDADRLIDALEGIEVWGGGGLLRRNKLNTLFSRQQARLLGQHISVGLSRASADQDIVFVLARSEKKYYVIQNTGYTGGRVFYLDEQLHIIIGDYNSSGDRFKEAAHRSHGVTDVKQYFRHGRRARPSGFKDSVVGSEGVSTHEDGSKVRRDWLVIDLEQAAAAYLAEKERQEAREISAADAAVQAETAKLAQERREMRLELAKMRKEIKESGGGDASRTVEQRLEALEELREKELISEEEYQRKREQILGEL